MRIQHNIAALNSYRNLVNNNSAVSKNLEKLSSGYRINRAGDDAAGLAISEKMRAQITGLNTAQKNANDGISLVQTAEGALTEVHSMLNRMVELANQSANGTYADAPDRENLQAEIDSLLTEIDRISQATNFNGINLLDGTLGLNSKAFEIGTATAAREASTINGLDNSSALAVTATHESTSTGEAKTPEFTVDFADLQITLADNPNTAAAATTSFDLSIGGETVKIADSAADADLTAAVNTVDFDVNAATAAGTVVTPTAGTVLAAGDLATKLDGKAAIIDGNVFTMAKDGTKVTFTYAGTWDGTTYTADNDGDTVDGDTFIPKGNVTIDESNNGTSATIENRDNCHVTEITDPVAGSAPVRSGASLVLDKDIIDAGSLKIGDTTFKFDWTKTEAEATDNGTIGLKGLENASTEELLKAVSRQFADGKTATIKKKDDAGTEQSYTFDIGRGTDTNVIEIEEQIAANQATGKYGNFKADELKAAFTQSRGAANASNTVTLNEKPKEGDTIQVNGKTYKFGGETDAANNIVGVKIGTDAATSAKNLADAIKKDTGVKVEVNGGTVKVSATTAAGKAPEIGSSGLTLQIGDTSDLFNRMTVGVANMSSTSLGIHDIDISTQNGAQEAVDKIKDAINTVSSQRGDLGAIQNRLEHTINNLSVTAENMTAAESRIRDVDMAEEMMAYTKNNILVQAAQAMLAQANQVPQGVLQLLQ